MNIFLHVSQIFMILLDFKSVDDYLKHIFKFTIIFLIRNEDGRRLFSQTQKFLMICRNLF